MKIKYVSSKETYSTEERVVPVVHTQELLLFLWDSPIHGFSEKISQKFYEKTNFMRNSVKAGILICIYKNKQSWLPVGGRGEG